MCSHVPPAGEYDKAIIEGFIHFMESRVNNPKLFMKNSLPMLIGSDTKMLSSVRSSFTSQQERSVSSSLYDWKVPGQAMMESTPSWGLLSYLLFEA